MTERLDPRVINARTLLDQATFSSLFAASFIKLNTDLNRTFIWNKESGFGSYFENKDEFIAGAAANGGFRVIDLCDAEEFPDLEFPDGAIVIVSTNQRIALVHPEAHDQESFSLQHLKTLLRQS